MEILDFLDFEDGQNGTLYSHPNWSRHGNAFSMDMAAKHGNMGVALEANGAFSRAFPISVNQVRQTASFYFNMALWGTVFTLASARLGVATMNNRFPSCYWSITPERKVAAFNGNGTQSQTSVEVLDLDTWYRAEWSVYRLTSVSSKHDVTIYEGESRIPLLTVTANADGPMDMVRVGASNAVGSITMFLDTLKLADGGVGPHDPIDWFLYNAPNDIPLKNPAMYFGGPSAGM